jgi:hypothetical protein
MGRIDVVECEVPAGSALRPNLVAAAYFLDAYRAPLTSRNASVVELFHALFNHHPLWMKVVLLIRHRLAAVCGLAVPTTHEVLRPEPSKAYGVGEKIGVWPIFGLNERELIAGRDNKHLDFRLSIFREPNGAIPTVVVSTACIVHNRFGKVYLWLIEPFHRWGVRHIIVRAIHAGRL